MSNTQQSQFSNPNSQSKVLNFNWLEDSERDISELKEKNDDESKEVYRDWFWEAFLLSYKMEKDRRKRMGAEKEEREKKMMAEKLSPLAKAATHLLQERQCLLSRLLNST